MEEPTRGQEIAALRESARQVRRYVACFSDEAFVRRWLAVAAAKERQADRLEREAQGAA